jgi:hypothetical protein
VAAGQIFSDDLGSGVNWTIAQDADSSAEFGYDYSQKGIPAAPRGGGDTIGLKFEVNNNAPADATGIVALNANAAYTGQYTFRVDAWINWAPDGGGVGTGTTEFIGAAVGHGGFAALPLGGSFIYTSEGDAAATDYRLYKENNQIQAETGQYAAGNVAGSRDSSDPYYTDAFPAFDIAAAVPAQGSSGTQPAGAGGFQWMTLNFEVDTETLGPAGNTTDLGFARISMRSASSGNTIVIGTIDNSNGDFFPASLEGSIALQMYDLFSSVTLNPAFSFAIFDNVQVFSGLVPLTSDILAGDYNENDVVDAADYTVWRDNLGNAAGTLPNDGDGGTIGQAQYDTWVANFGMVKAMGQAAVGQSAVGQSAVPEPMALVLLISALFPIALAGRVSGRRQSRRSAAATRWFVGIPLVLCTPILVRVGIARRQR